MSDPDRKRVMMDRSGKYVISIMDAAYCEERDAVLLCPESAFSLILQCLICLDRLTDAVMIFHAAGAARDSFIAFYFKE